MFWKENKKIIEKLWINQFGAIVFGIMLVFMASAITARMSENKTPIYIAVGIVGMLFYCYLIYLHIWEVGAKASIRIEGEGAAPRPHYGLKIALFAAIPAFVATGIYLISAFLFGICGIDNQIIRGIISVSATASLIIEAPYLGFAFAIFKEIGQNITFTDMCFPYALFWTLSVLPAIIATWGSYLLGYRGKLMSWAYKPKKK